MCCRLFAVYSINACLIVYAKQSKLHATTGCSSGTLFHHSRFCTESELLTVFILYYIDYNYVSYSAVSITFIYPIVPIEHSKNSGSKQKILKNCFYWKEAPCKKIRAFLCVCVSTEPIVRFAYVPSANVLIVFCLALFNANAYTLCKCVYFWRRIAKCQTL